MPSFWFYAKYPSDVKLAAGRFPRGRIFLFRFATLVINSTQRNVTPITYSRHAARSRGRFISLSARATVKVSDAIIIDVFKVCLQTRTSF